jgi:hypothetical protein
MRRRMKAFAAITAAMTVGALASASTALAVPADFYGLVPQGTPSASDVERMGQGKVGSARVLVNWAAVEPANDQFDFDALDSYIGNLAASGIQPFPYVYGSAPFISSDVKDLPASGNDLAEWEEFVRTVGARYGQGGTYWSTVYPVQHPGANPKPFKDVQVWNEENAPKYTNPVSPSAYAKVLKSTNTALAAIAPQIRIVLGGMFGKPTGAGSVKAWSFLKRLYGEPGAKGDFEAVSLHPYSPDVEGIVKQIEKLRKVLKQKKDKGAKLWITEIGWGSDNAGRLGVGSKKQGKLLKESFKLFKQKRGKYKIGGVLWYTWRDTTNADTDCDWCSSAGLFPRTGDSPKPAWKSFVKFTKGS